MLADRLSKAWRARRGSTALDPIMRFSEEGLVLGAGTVLVKSIGSGRTVEVDPREPRLYALLTAAHLRRPSADGLAHLAKAVERWGQGDDTLAAIHLAHSRLDRLEKPQEDAHRLFLAEGLLNAGVEPEVVVKAAEAGHSAFERLHKYNPDQPRVPSGSGRTSGEWTSGDTATSPSPEVNPSTITPTASFPYRGPDACHQAKRDCMDAAIDAAEQSRPNESAGDNMRAMGADFENCSEAERRCEVLAFAIDKTPFLDRGGVIFPHKGVVIIQKGEDELYIPPPARGRIPPFRRSQSISRW